MTRRGGAGLDYAEISAQTNDAEHELHGLLDELIDTLNRAQSEEALTSQAREIAQSAATLAAELEIADMKEMGEKTKDIDELSEKTERLLQALPDAVLAAEHPKWSAEMEDVQTQIRSIRGLVEQLAWPHLSDGQRAAHEEKVRSHLSSTRQRLSRLKRAVRGKEQAREHPLHIQLTRVKGAIEQAQYHLNTKMKMHLRAQKEMEARRKAEEETARVAQEQQQFEQDISSAAEEMRQSFAKQMSGRLYVDWHTIQMRSQLTGQVREWPMDDARAAALGRLMGNWDVVRTLERVRGRQSSLAAGFEVVYGEDGIRLVLDGGERTISAEAVVLTPQKYVVAL